MLLLLFLFLFLFLFLISTQAALLQGGGGLVVTPNGEVVSAEEIVRRVQAEKHESFHATKVTRSLPLTKSRASLQCPNLVPLCCCFQAEIKSNMQRSMVMQSENASILRLLLVASHAVGKRTRTMQWG